MRPRLLLAVTASAAVAAPAFLPLGGSALAQDSGELAIRAIGTTLLGTSSSASNLSTFCITAGTNATADCDVQGVGTITVSAATKKTFKLPSTTVAKGSYVKAGEGGVFKLTTTSATRTKLKASKGRLVPVTYKLAITSPITETVTKKADMRIGSGAVKQLVLRSAGDTFAVGGGRG